MPAFASVDELRQSTLFASLAALQKMGNAKLQRFVNLFAKVYNRAIRGGATDKDAESRALPIAFVGAQKATIMPAGRIIEEKVATYALFAADMAHGAGVDTDMKFADLEDVGDLMQGQTFFGHAHDRDLAEPLGVIRRIMATKDLPADIRAKVDPDIVIVAQTSFFADVPAEDRLTSISPEWTTVKSATGEELQIPTNFITTKSPANAEVLGIRRIAESNGDAKERLYLQIIASSSSRDIVPDKLTIEGLTAKVAEMQAELDTANASKVASSDLQTKLASLEAKHTDLVAKMASLAGVSAKGNEAPKEGEVVKTLTSKLAELQSSVLALETASKQKEAEAWADEVLKAKEVAMDSKAKFASLYMLNKESALALEASLTPRILKPGESQAIVNLKKLEPKAAEERLTFLKGAF